MAFQIYKENGDIFEGLTLHRVAFESVVMSLSDKITGEVLYKNNQLPYTMREYVVYNGTKYYLKNPPTIVRNGMADSSENGFTKYSFEFYHPSIQLFSMPFTDIAVNSNELQYKAEDKTFYWIGTLTDFCTKINKNLKDTIFTCSCAIYKDGTSADTGVVSEVLSFDNVTIADALKTGYETFKAPYVIEDILPSDNDYNNGKKKYRIRFGKPSNEILDKEGKPFVFKFGQGLGLKNNSATPKNNKIITRIAGQGSETNIPWGYPQIKWEGDKTWNYTKNNQIGEGSYPIYNGVVDGKTVRLIKHPFTRKRLMPSIYAETVDKKVNPLAVGYNPDLPLVDYYDADESYTNPINQSAPSYEHHVFEEIKPSIKKVEYKGTRIDEIYDVYPINNEGVDVKEWDDSVDKDGNYVQSYFRLVLPRLGFDLYAHAIENQPMVISVEEGECAGCKFEIQVNWEDWKNNFYIKNEQGELVFDDGTKTDSRGVYIPEDSHRDAKKYPLSIESPISVIVKKDIETFGTIYPNVHQQPKKSDDYVFLGISLPSIYITKKQKELDETAKQYMRENNVYYFEYPLKFDEFFLENNRNILSQIKTNSLIRFEFASQNLALSVKQIAIKFDEDVLPQYDIVLTDEISVVLNSIGQVTEGLSRLGSQVSALQAYYNKSLVKELASELKKKLSKVYDDTANGKITFNKGIQIGDYASGLSGFGGRIDEKANAELESLAIRRFLEVPELRYNRTEIEIGNTWNSFGGGIIESCIIDTAPNGKILNTGTIHLKLEEGEIGSVAVDDICMGIFHDEIDLSNNADKDADDGKGNFSFSGFYTVYFRITEVLDKNRRSKFKYSLRAKPNQTKFLHPSASMNFVGYGNFSDKSRQTSRYSTRTYQRYLRDVNNWEFTSAMIAAQFGDLSNLSVFGLSMSGYSAYLDNIYMSGVLKQFQDELDSYPLRLEIDTEGDNALAYGEFLHVSCKVLKGWKDLTNDVTQWTITRDSGFPQEDAAWSLRKKVKEFKGVIDLHLDKDKSIDDLGKSDISTLFTITALVNTDKIETQLII